MVGTAIVPTAENPVRNFPASAHPPEESPLGSPKNKYGMGTNTYMKAVVCGRFGGRVSDSWSTVDRGVKCLPVSIGHQLCHREHPSI